MNSSKIKEIYSLRQNFSIIGLTGRTGSGVSIVGDILNSNFEEIKHLQPRKLIDDKTNDKNRKYNISYDYCEKNWKKYTVIKYRDVLLLHLLRSSDNEIRKFLDENGFKIFEDIIFKIIKDENILIEKEGVSTSSIVLKLKEIGIIDKNLKSRNKLIELGKIFYSESFSKISKILNDELYKKDIIQRIKFFKSLSNNLRSSSKIYSENKNQNLCTDCIYTIAETINRLIKSYRILNYKSDCHIVIDSLRNSLEVMFFKERFSAFYLFAINSIHSKRFLFERYKQEKREITEEILKIDLEEYEGKGIKEGKFYEQDVQNCIQNSDVYFNNNPVIENTNDYENDTEELIRQSKNYLFGQVIRYTSLILHPGLITPSAQERCMQIANVAKANSGCISRKVGALITDEKFSIKSIGWNDVATNSTSCLLRNISDLVNNKDEKAYSPFEKDRNGKYLEAFKKYYIEIGNRTIEGLNCSFCFKDIYNLFEKNENQVHTRSLHAEENAMLQISKFGGQPIKNGILFTTASPCELCSKKAKQLEIKEIYYIDPYPGISYKHILRDGENSPRFILYSGAIGKAYHRLYDPIVNYKDELALIIDKRPKKDLKEKKYI